MTDDSNHSAVTLEHAIQFGFIINIFAKIEMQMQITAAGILDTDLGTALILMGDTHYRQKQTTLRNLHATRGIDGYPNQQLIEILDEVSELSKLRNHIAHATWVAGRKPGSIKPMGMVLRGGKPRPYGHNQNEKNYTAADLEAPARRLEAISKRFTKFLSESGLEAKVQANIDAIISSTTASPGKPSSK